MSFTHQTLNTERVMTYLESLVHQMTTNTDLQYHRHFQHCWKKQTKWIS